MHLPASLAILGGGESGVGAALLATHLGIPCFLSEGKQLGDAHRAELEAAGISYEEGGHNVQQLLGFAAVVKSPGIPPPLRWSRHYVRRAYPFGLT